MTLRSTAYRYWRAAALIGVCLIVVGLGVGYVDVLTKFSFISDNDYEIFSLIAVFGILLAIAGCIGWAIYLGKQHRVFMAVAAFAFPWILLIVGYPIGGTNMHGPAAPVMLMMIPASILAIVLLGMAAFRSAN